VSSKKAMRRLRKVTTLWRSVATTSFGSRTVAKEEKAGLVSEVFTSVASRYDVMNDLMSGGMHRLWKDDFVRRLGLRACARATGEAPRCLDVAGGTGDIAFRIVDALGPWLAAEANNDDDGDDDDSPDDSSPKKKRVVVSDANADMLEVGRTKAQKRRLSCMAFEVGDAQNLPYEDASFDFVTISFGLRNVTDVDEALREMKRVLKPGGRFECLEFSRVHHPLLNTLYATYSKHVIPELGRRVAGDRESYEYLVESIKRHPDQLHLLSRLANAGFERPSYRDMTFGVVAVHSGYAPLL